MAEFSGGPGEPDMDTPPYSRLFIACGKQHTDQQLREAFSEFGKIETLFIVRDKARESKGIAFVKFNLTSSAALAQERLDKTTLGDDDKPISVCIASSKTQQKNYDINDNASRNRLYVFVPPGDTEEDLEEAFRKFDGYQSCQIVKSGRGAFLSFSKPSTAALALEGCARKYHARVADPRPDSRSPFTGRAGDPGRKGLKESGPGPVQPGYPRPTGPLLPAAMAAPLISFSPDSAGLAACLCVRTTSQAAAKQMKVLCDIPPNMVTCQVVKSPDGQETLAYAVYASATAAYYARSKLEAFEYPPGSPLRVTFIDDRCAGAGPGDELSGRLSSKSSNGAGYAEGAGGGGANGSGDPPLPLRVFFVCTPTPPPMAALRAAFSPFGCLVNIWLTGNHNYGYAEFASVTSTLLATSQLNETNVGGSQLKVVLADRPKPGSNQTSRRGSG